MANRLKPILATTVPPQLAEYAKNQASTRGVSLSTVVAEALELMQVGLVYQVDTKSIISVSENQQKKHRSLAG